MRAFRSAMAVLSVLFLLAGIAWPHLALRFLQGLVATLAASYIAFRMYRAGLPTGLASDTYSPFNAGVPERPLSAQPAAVRDLAMLLEPAHDEELAERFLVPAAAQRIMTTEATRRLAEHHGLDVRDPADHSRIEKRVSTSTWALLRPGGEARRQDYNRPVPLSHLEQIIDDLETL